MIQTFASKHGLRPNDAGWEFVHYDVGEMVTYTGKSGEVHLVRVVAGPVMHRDAGDERRCYEVAFLDEGGKVYCVPATQLRPRD